MFKHKDKIKQIMIYSLIGFHMFKCQDKIEQIN